MSRFYITTAIDYVNSRPHLGTAYEKIAADVIARYKRLCGIETRFLMGNDEHSQNVFKQATDEGLDPLTYCDRMESVFRDTWSRLDISFDDFIRTTEARHRVGVTHLAQRLYEAGDIYEGLYEGWYCVGCEGFKPEKDLTNGRCPLHPTLTPEWLREKNYFFRLSRYRERLAEHLDRHPEFIGPAVRRNEIVRLIEGGLEDISVSRAGQAWGIPLPFDRSSVVYVWFDALANYATAVGLGGDEALFGQWWPADLHVIGKDITRFHAVIWPAMLMAADLPVPRAIFGHGFMTVDGQRMSKSLGNVVNPIDAVDRLQTRYGLTPAIARRIGPDPLRLYLTKEITFGGDGDFSWDRYDERYGVDLSNNLGNLVSRVASMVGRYCKGRVRPRAEATGRLAAAGDEAARSYRTAMDALALSEGAGAVFRLVDATNEYIAETSPWALAKDPANQARVEQVLFDAAEAIRLAAILLTPIMPRSAAEILRRVGGETAIPRLDRDGTWRSAGERVILQEDSLWPRLEPHSTKGSNKETTVSENLKEPSGPNVGSASILPSAPSTPAPGVGPAAPVVAAPASDRISIDDFMKVDLRVAKVLGAERVPKSSKLLKLLVDTGQDHRTIVAGIAEAYEPEALVGRTVVVVANLKPAKLMGVESNGMVLAASAEGGKPMLLAFEHPPAPGTRVR
mgnify:CR=1 FL=1